MLCLVINKHILQKKTFSFSYVICYLGLLLCLLSGMSPHNVNTIWSNDKPLYFTLFVIRYVSMYVPEQC